MARADPACAADLAEESAETAASDSVTVIRDRAGPLDRPGVEVAAGRAGGLIGDLVQVFSSINPFLLIVTVLLSALPPVGT